MKFETQSNEEYELIPIHKDTVPPLYWVRRKVNNERTEYAAGLLAPNPILVGLGVRFLIEHATRESEIEQTSLVTELDNFDDRPSISSLIVEKMETSTFDFRTVDSLADELDVSPKIIRLGLVSLGDTVRQPLVQKEKYPDWYRLTKKGPTKQESRNI